jgi:hypothetical protein
MDTYEFGYLCVVIGAMALFAAVLAWGDWYTRRARKS